MTDYRVEGSKVYIKTPVMRIVGGSPLIYSENRDPITKELRFDKNGQVSKTCWFITALPKIQGAQFIEAARKAASMLFPQAQLLGTAIDQQGNIGLRNSGVPNNFAWKIKDGDFDTDQKGRPHSQFVGRSGCYVINFSTQIPVPVSVFNGIIQQQIFSGVKAGDYIQVYASLEAHSPKRVNDTPGIYMSPLGVTLVGVGEEINFGPDMTEIFGNTAPILPQGAMPVDLSQYGQPPVGQPAPQQYGQPPVGQPAPQQYGQPAVQLETDAQFLQNLISGQK